MKEELNKKLLVIRVKGKLNMPFTFKYMLANIGIKKKFSAALLNDSETNRKMLRKARPYIAYGEADKDTVSYFKDSKIINLCPPLGGVKIKLGVNELFRRMTK